MIRASIGSLVFFLVAACDRAPTIPSAGVLTTADVAGGAVATGPSASGAGTIEFGASKEHVSFNASGVLTPATGSAEIHDNTVSGNVNAHVSINCLNVVGNQATISGIITQTNDPTIQGFEALWQVRDNGEGRKDAPDMMSPVLIFEVGVGPDCTVPSEFDLVNLKGNVRVVP